MLNERKLSQNEIEQRKIALKGLLKNKRTLVKKYGKDAEKVMYGIATKQAKSKVENMNKDKIKELIQQTLRENTPVKESLNPEVSKKVDQFIKAMAKRYGYSEQDAVYAIMAALKQRKFDGLDERVAKIDEMLGEMDINDPVLMRMRASKQEPSRGGIDYDEALTLRGIKAEIEDEIAQLYRDMEQEAEPEGGEVADRYGRELEKLEARLYKVQKQLRDYDMNESTRQDLGMSSSISKSRAKAHLNNPSNDGSKVYGLDSDGKRVELKDLNDVDKFKKFELDADLKEGASKEDQLKVAKAAFDKAEKDSDIRGQELALAAIDLINGNINEAMGGGQLFDYFNKEYVVGDHFHSDDSYIVKREPSGKDQYVIFDYDKDKDQFQIRQMGGYRIDQKDAMKAGMRETGITRVAGIDSYMVDGNYSPTPISIEGLKDIVDHVMGGLSREAASQQDFYARRGKTSGTIDELKSKILSTVKEVMDSRKKKGFKVGDKITYLGHPGEITKVNKEVTGDISYNVSYNKGNGKTKTSNIYNKGGEIKAV
jgi:hypothetical protein